MPWRVRLATRLAAPPEQVWSALQSPRLMREVSWPLIIFRARDPLPTVWTPGRYRVSLWLFGLLPLGRQWIGAELPPAEGDVQFLRDNGSGDLIRTWDHRIRIEPDLFGATHYEDDVHIAAGPLTPVVWAFARLLFTWRQYRLREMAARHFRPR